MDESYLMLDLDDMLRRAEAGDIDGTDVSALVADVRRKHRLLVEAETARHTTEKQVFGVSGELATARRVIDAAQSMLGAALMPGHPEGGPLLGEGIRQLVAELDQARQQRDTANAACVAVEEDLKDMSRRHTEAREARERVLATCLALWAENEVLRPAVDEVTRRRAGEAGAVPQPDPWAQVTQLRAALERNALDEPATDAEVTTTVEEGSYALGCMGYQAIAFAALWATDQSATERWMAGQ